MQMMNHCNRTFTNYETVELDLIYVALHECENMIAGLNAMRVVVWSCHQGSADSNVEPD